MAPFFRTRYIKLVSNTAEVPLINLFSLQIRGDRIAFHCVLFCTTGISTVFSALTVHMFNGTFVTRRGRTTCLPSATAREHLLRWQHCTGCASQNACRTKLRCRLSKCFTTARHDIWDLLSPSLTCPVGELCGQQVPAA